MDGPHDELRRDALDAVCACAVLLGPDFSIFVPIIRKVMVVYKQVVLCFAASNRQGRAAVGSGHVLLCDPWVWFVCEIADNCPACQQGIYGLVRAEYIRAQANEASGATRKGFQQVFRCCHQPLRPSLLEQMLAILTV
jgi:hypothetical protein